MGSTKYYDLMEKQLLLALSLLAFSSYDFVRPNEEPSIKVNTAANTDQGSTHESIALVKEDGKWKALNDKKGRARQGKYILVDTFGNPVDPIYPPGLSNSTLHGLAGSGRFQ